MNVGMMMERISNGYYRSMEGLIRDIDVMVYNCKSFNGDNTMITRECVKIGRVLKNIVNGVEDHQDFK